MDSLVEAMINNITDFMKTSGPIVGMIVVMFESIIPILPLGIFITFNVYAYGLFWGFIISWIGTLIGCYLSFMSFRKWLRGYFWQKIESKERLINFMNYMTNINFNQLVLLISLPFSPAFLINIGAGLSKMPLKKFMIAAIIGKISIIYFWGYIGTSMIESISNPSVLLEIIIALTIAHLVSKVASKKLNIE
ncbi:MAG: TVP38/TMEM64 family protein [Bacilli bacterium]|jgi:uncharacterized membrane protein YdjX (TVP38/TMEM64 family)